jgi:hypothetical protein
MHQKMLMNLIAMNLITYEFNRQNFVYMNLIPILASTSIMLFHNLIWLL